METRRLKVGDVVEFPGLKGTVAFITPEILVHVAPEGGVARDEHRQQGGRAIPNAEVPRPDFDQLKKVEAERDALLRDLHELRARLDAMPRTADGVPLGEVPSVLYEVAGTEPGLSIVVHSPPKLRRTNTDGWVSQLAPDGGLINSVTGRPWTTLGKLYAQRSVAERVLLERVTAWAHKANSQDDGA